jgi:TetR/AcrR family transcriptional regulator
MSWTERAADRSPTVQRSRQRSIEQAKVLVDAARRLMSEKGDSFTTQELAKEAGVALQTFYRHFPGKDQLLLAVVEDTITESCTWFEEQARELPDPVARLRFYVTAALGALDTDHVDLAAQRFATSQHWRLHQRFPDELARATRPFAEMLHREILAATDAGQLDPPNPERDAWLITQLIMTVFHHYAYATPDDTGTDISEDTWAFCLNALGGRPTRTSARRRRRSTRTAPDD